MTYVTKPFSPNVERTKCMNNHKSHAFTVALVAIIMANFAYANSPTITGVTAQQRYPWDGKVDISYTVTGDIIEVAKQQAVLASLKVTAIDIVANTTNTATQLSGDLSLDEGTHAIVWDVEAEGLSLQLNDVVFKVSCETTNALYCVIDLSAGATASSYPVTYLAEPPSGGFNVDEYKTIKLVLKRIEAGAFIMGSDQANESHRVMLTKPFFCGIFEVTQKQYQQIMGGNPSAYKGDMRPIDAVSYNMIRGSSNGAQWPSSSVVDATSFIGKLRERTGQDFDIPTNAQWEYACRAGTKSKYNNGGNTENDLAELGRYVGNQSDGRGGYVSAHTTVGSYSPNGWGLYDMHGNVWEWCLDWYGTLTYGNDPTGSSSGSNRILRGGTWKLSADRCSLSDNGDNFWPTDVYDDTGFRIVRTLSNVETIGILCTGTSVVACDNVVYITNDSTSGYTMTDGNTYVIQNSVSFSNSTAGGSGMTIEDGATVVIFVPSNVTLTAIGANGSGQTGGGAGILVPETSTLIITGEGTVNVTGGNAGNGGDGSNGSKGRVWVSNVSGMGMVAGGESGVGGTGGDGGGGAGAGIGGAGTNGGNGGNGAEGAYVSTAAMLSMFCKDGNYGESGSVGNNGSAMGNCYILGRISVVAIAGNSGSAGNAGDVADMAGATYLNYDNKRYYFASCGGGGGGGGGAGTKAPCAIGGGGSAGGGGGGGGSGATVAADSQVTNAHGGGGNGGESFASSGYSGNNRGGAKGYYGGSGGRRGAAGAEGDPGLLFVSPTATVNVEREKMSAITHSAVQYTIMFDVNEGMFSTSVESLSVTLGCDLPDCISTPTRLGYVFDGWRTMTGDEYYTASGTKSISSYALANDIVLYAQWHLDDKFVVPGNTFWARENAEMGWLIDTGIEDGVVLRSGQIGNSTNSWMETSIVGPASFSFDWKVSCNTRGHYLAWSIDDVEQSRIRGEVDWTTVAASIPEGEHVVRFDYVKGSTTAAGEDKGLVRNFSIDPVRIETETMQVMWDWTTNYLVSVATTGFGTSDFENGWIADGSNVVVKIAPSIHSYFIALSGDTEGTILDGTNLVFQVSAARSIGVSIDEVKPHLVVVSTQGTPTPATGDNLFNSDAEVTASVVAPDPAGGVRAVCTGWTGTGSVPASGNSNSVSFVITADSSITWNWATNYWCEFSVVGNGSTSYEAQWVSDGTNLVLPFTVNSSFYTLSLSGDTDGAVVQDGYVTVPISEPRSIVLNVIEKKPHLVVVSAHGTPTPSVGDNLCDFNSKITTSVEESEPVNGTCYLCAGWTGSGSVPAFGDSNTVSFVITADSSITWNWTTNHLIDFSIIGKGTTTYETQWVAEGTSLVIPFSVNTPFYSLSLSGDADGAVLGDGGITVPITAPRSIVLNVTEYTYETALDGGRLSWTSGGTANWIPQGEVSHDGEDAVKSGGVTGDDVSTLSTVVTGPGTLTWWWKLDMSDCAGVDVFVDGVFVESLDTVSNWVSASIDIAGDGEHTVRFEFWNAGTAAAISDCAYLDQVSWTPVGGVVDHTATTPEPVPYSYFETDYPTLLTEYGGDYEAAAKATAANGLNKVWECYVAGISPTNETAKFTAVIEMVDGLPHVTWLPNLNTNGEVRVYTVFGKTNLTDAAWVCPTNAAHRFFKVKVEMP